MLLTLKDIITSPVRGLLSRLFSTKEPSESRLTLIGEKDFEKCIHLDGSRRIDNGSTGYCGLGENFRDRKDICPLSRTTSHRLVV